MFYVIVIVQGVGFIWPDFLRVRWIEPLPYIIDRRDACPTSIIMLRAFIDFWILSFYGQTQGPLLHIIHYYFLHEIFEMILFWFLNTGFYSFPYSLYTTYYILIILYAKRSMLSAIFFTRYDSRNTRYELDSWLLNSVLFTRYSILFLLPAIFLHTSTLNAVRSSYGIY